MEFEVLMERRSTLNAYQNARRRTAYVRAANEQAALAEANRKYPEFKAKSARKAAGLVSRWVA